MKLIVGRRRDAGVPQMGDTCTAGDRLARISARLRSPYDGAILRLAAPALGALAAEPLYILVDTAIVGHLGRAQLAALGAAATALSVLAMFNFLQYGTTAQVARATGAGEDAIAARLGAQSLWLSLAVGVGLTLLLVALADQVVAAIGVDGKTADYAATYLRIVALGLPSAFVALGGQGYLRGISDLRTPLLIVIAGNALNVVLEVVLVYGLDAGIEGSAWGTAIAQTVMGALFVVAILRRVGRGRAGLRPALARRLLSVGKFIFIRTAALMAAFILTGAVVARLGDPELAAYQIAFQLWIFLALVLDSIAIAGQIIVGRELGAGRAGDAYEASVRMVQLSVALGAVFAIALLALVDVLPRIFTSDPAVLEQCRELWPIFALTQPAAGAVFAFDGILIGASDGPFIAASMVLSFLACVVVLVAALVADWGVRGAWAALATLILVRLATMATRFRRRKWLVTGFA
jgi:MATE family, multidrug efflux pump